MAYLRVAGQGIELPAGDLEHPTASQMTLDLEVVAPGEPFDMRRVAVDDNLHRLVRAGFEPVGQFLRQLCAAARTGVYNRWERQRHGQAARQGRLDPPCAMFPPAKPLNARQRTKTECAAGMRCAGEHHNCRRYLPRPIRVSECSICHRVQLAWYGPCQRL